MSNASRSDRLRPLLGIAAIALLVVAVGVLGWREIGSFTHDSFHGHELIVWMVLALLTGGVLFGGSQRQPPVVAAALVASAVLLGAGPAEGIAVAVAGGLGSICRDRTAWRLRLLSASAFGGALPGVLAVAATIGGPSLGGSHELPLAVLVTLWLLVAIAIPVTESAGSRLVLPRAEHVDVTHVLVKRIEPQTVLVAVAIVAALTFHALGFAALAFLFLPLYTARTGLRLHEEGRRAVTQTLAAMTQLPEWVGAVDRHHTTRVVAAVEAAAVELGLESRLRRDIVRAASLHELGHLDGGVTHGDRGRIARSGAAVIEQAAVSPRVASMVRATDPERDLYSERDDVALGAALVAHACALDREAVIDEPASIVAALIAAARTRRQPVAAI